jgi:hypothetical protein
MMYVEGRPVDTFVSFWEADNIDVILFKGEYSVTPSAQYVPRKGNRFLFRKLEIVEIYDKIKTV